MSSSLLPSSNGPAFVSNEPQLLTIWESHVRLYVEHFLLTQRLQSEEQEVLVNTSRVSDLVLNRLMAIQH